MGYAEKWEDPRERWTKSWAKEGLWGKKKCHIWHLRLWRPGEVSRSFQQAKKLTKVLKVSSKHPCESRGEETGIGAADLGANRKVDAPSAPSQLTFPTNSLSEASLPTGESVFPEAAFRQAPVYYMCA